MWVDKVSIEFFIPLFFTTLSKNFMFGVDRLIKRWKEEKDIIPDFWLKTLHHHNYWSSQAEAYKENVPGQNFKDNMWCYKLQEKFDFMDSLEQPWIALKVLAAGAIQPKDGFKFAFDSGADFICVGMYDFQIVEDVNILLDVLPKVERKRDWMA